jgi:hypothetical protein
MELISIDKLNQVCAQDEFSFVIFGSLDCPPCAILKWTIEEVEDTYSAIKFYMFDVKESQETFELGKKYDIHFLPRSIIFRNGIECGRLLFEKTPDQLRYFLDPLFVGDRMPSDPQDSEAVTKLIAKTQKALGWNFRRDFPYEEWQGKGQELLGIAERVMLSSKYWGYLTEEEILLNIA